MSDFDPYHQWLGMPRGVIPSDHELLGLEADDFEPERIKKQAAIARSTIRRVRPGQYSKQWMELIDEIQSAEQRLLEAAGSPRAAGESPAIGTDPPMARPLQMASSTSSATPSPPPTAQTEPPPIVPPPVPPPVPNSVSDQVANLVQVGDGGGRRLLKRKSGVAAVLFWSGHLVVLALVGILGWFLLRPGGLLNKQPIQEIAGVDSAEDKGDGKQPRLPNTNSKSTEGSKEEDSGKSGVKQGNPEIAPAAGGQQEAVSKPSEPGSQAEPDGGSEASENDHGGGASAPEIRPANLLRARLWLASLRDRRSNVAEGEWATLSQKMKRANEQQMLARMELVWQLYQEFWQVVAERAGQISGGTQLEVETNGETLRMGVVESSREKMVLKVNGQIMRFRVELLPEALALRLCSDHLGARSTRYRLLAGVFWALRCFDPEIGDMRLAQGIAMLESTVEESELAAPLLEFWQRDLQRIQQLSEPAASGFDWKTVINGGAGEIPELQLTIELLANCDATDALSADVVQQGWAAVANMAASGDASCFYLLDFLNDRWPDAGLEAMNQVIVLFACSDSSNAELVATFRFVDQLLGSSANSAKISETSKAALKHWLEIAAERQLEVESQAIEKLLSKR